MLVLRIGARLGTAEHEGRGNTIDVDSVDVADGDGGIPSSVRDGTAACGVFPFFAPPI